jgi:drug/metabolite transporter (DMT)-like permease
MVDAPDVPTLSRQRKAVERLTLATLFWGISFPVMKAITMDQAAVLPSSTNSWFISSSAMSLRFGAAAVLMFLWTFRSLGRLTRSEVAQGFGLGLFAGFGMLLQIDGLAYTSASTSAFLTQSYCVFLPVVVAAQVRQRPSLLMITCSLLAVSGVAVLANVDWHHFRLGRGEFETLMSSIVFGGQILWLERPTFARNRVSHFTLLMFGTMTLVALPVSLFTMRDPADWAVICFSPAVLGLTSILVLCCTMIAFVMMNYWQPLIPAPEAAIIYAAEPVFASLFAMVLPAWLSRISRVTYANEKLTSGLLIGGGLITLANLLVQVRAWRESVAQSKTARPT